MISSRRHRFLITSVCLLLASGVSAVRSQEAEVRSSAQTASALEAANQLYREGRLTAAAEAFKAIIKSDDQSALAYVGLARASLALKNPEEATDAVQKAARLAPSLEAVHVALGEVYFRQGKLAEAEKEFTPLVKGNSKEARAYLGLSRFYHAVSFYRFAKGAIDRAHELDPGDPDILKTWIRTLSGAEQIRALQAYLAAHPDEDSQQHSSELEHLNVLQNGSSEGFHPCRLLTKVNQAEIKMDRLYYDARRIRAYALSVKINEGSGKLLLDTGASGIVIDRSLAEKAGIKPITNVKVKGVGDKAPAGAYLGYADAVKIGNLEFQDCYVRVIDRGSVADSDGLIGADVFSHFLVELDYPDERIRLSELPQRPEVSSTGDLSSFKNRYVAPVMKNYTAVYRFGHMLLVYTELNHPPGKLFLLDTGAASNTISPAAAREFTRVSADADTRVRGVNGSVKDVFRADDLTFQFGHLSQKNLDVVSFDTRSISNSIGVEVSGTLGFAMLRLLDIKIDYRDGLVDFSYDPNRIKR